ncbi:MAG: phytanoyl-CoA dioxygenase family protein [Pseudomonadota bacterium]
MKDVVFYDLDSPEVAAFEAELDQTLNASDVPHASDIQKNVPIYDGIAVRPLLSEPETRRALLIEWAHVLGKLSGVIIIRGVYDDLSVIDRATDVFNAIIARQKDGAEGGGDHFAASGANDRIWNSLQKLAEADPEVFALYHGRPEIDGAAEAWLGPGYQITAQVNLVRPGGAAQSAHRDYHLGFMGADQAVRYPAHAHHLSTGLTLQGGIAHVDAPIEAGPTKFLPFSQAYGPGYLASGLGLFTDLFEDRCIQLPLAKGDAMFFSPALFHAAGANHSNDVARLVNLLQISSGFGRAMESVDRTAVSRAVFPVLRRMKDEGRMTPAELRAAVAASAEGYAFPTNLDTDPPVGGLAPETQAELLQRALDTGMNDQQFAEALAAQGLRRDA